MLPNRVKLTNIEERLSNDNHQSQNQDERENGLQTSSFGLFHHGTPRSFWKF
jgi:hypothetical protein